MKISNILIIKLRYLGDVLLITSFIQGLSQQYPNSIIHVLLNEGTEGVLLRHPCVKNILLVPRSSLKSQYQFFLSLRNFAYDCVIDLTDGDRSAFISALTGAPIRIGFNHERRWRGIFYTHCIDADYGSMHMVDYHAKALSPLGISAPIGDPQLFLSDEDDQAAARLSDDVGLTRSRWVMIHPSARYWFKAWPPERFAALGDALIDRGFQVVLVGSGQEMTVEKIILQQARHQFISLIGKTELLELGALMKQCNLFIGNDGGLMHMAAAVGCPVVALFGPTDPAVWGPRGHKSTVIYKGLNCADCFHPGCFRGEESCMKLITVEEVVRAAEERVSRNP